MEQGLEARARGDAGRKGEGARFAVNAEAGDGRRGDASPRWTGFIRNPPSLSAEGRLRRAAGAQREILFRDRRKRGEPQDRQRPENGRRVGEDESVEVVRNHEDGTRMGTGIPITKEEPAPR